VQATKFHKSGGDGDLSSAGTFVVAVAIHSQAYLNAPKHTLPFSPLRGSCWSKAYRGPIFSSWVME
jgi:hypothetical protein